MIRATQITRGKFHNETSYATNVSLKRIDKIGITVR